MGESRKEVVEGGGRCPYASKYAHVGEVLNGGEIYRLCATLSAEEIELFDLLRKDKMTVEEVEQVQMAIKALLQRLHMEQPPVLVWDVHKNFVAQRKLRTTIQQVFEHTLPESYDRILFLEKCDTVLYLMLEWSAKCETGWRSLLQRRY